MTAEPHLLFVVPSGKSECVSAPSVARTPEDIMRFSKFVLVGALVMSAVPVATSVRAEEEHEKIVKLEEIPAPARQTILREAKGAPILKVEIEKQGGRNVYEAHIRQGKDEIGIVVDAKGTLLGKHSEKDEK